MFAVTINIGFELFTERVYNTDAHAMQTAGHFVCLIVELTASMENGQYYFKGAFAGLFVDIDRNTNTVIFDRTTSINMDPNNDLIATAGQSLIDRVIKNFIDQMVETAGLGVSYIHIRTLANGLKPFEHLDITGIISLVCHISSFSFLLPALRP